MIWKDEYEIGILEIDEQHKQLFTLVNELKSSMVDKKSEDSILKAAIPEIVNYTIQHFKDEENIMRNLGFPGVDLQEHQHQFLIKEVKDILYQIRDGRKYNPIQLYNLLSQWLLKHFVVEDKKLRDFIKEKESVK